jgi:predicted transcriptional regulator
VLIAAKIAQFRLNINLRNTKKYLAKLKEQGKIKRVGSRKNGIWEAIEK